MAARSSCAGVVNSARTCIQALRRRLSEPQFAPGAERKCAPREAAVLIPLFEDTAGTVQVVLTERSRLLSSHAGEVALPGGKRDSTDATLVATALREAEEELRLVPRDVDVIAQLPPMLSKHLLSVTPIVGIITEPIYEALSPAPDEVDAMFAMPLQWFIEEHERHTFADAKMGAHTYRIHHFAYENYDVWGLTANILIRAAEEAFGERAAFDVMGEGMDYTRLQYDGEEISLRPTSPRARLPESSQPSC